MKQPKMSRFGSSGLNLLRFIQSAPKIGSDLLHQKNIAKCAEGKRFLSHKVKWSYRMSPGTVPLLGDTMGNLLEQRAERHPHRDALFFCDTRLRRTFEEFHLESDKLAAGFVSLGMKTGDRLGVWSSTNLEWLLAMYAAAKIGLILVSINPAYKAKELEYCLKKVNCTTLVISEGFRGSSYYDMLINLMPEIDDSVSVKISSQRFPDLKNIITIGDRVYPGTIRFSDVFSVAGSDDMDKVHELRNKIQSDDPASIQFTSGTTGHPKGVTLSHHQMINSAYISAQRAQFNEMETKICNSVPMNHTGGLILMGAQLAANGCSVVSNGAAFSSTQILKAIQNERITHYMAVPTMFIDVVNDKDIDKYDVTTLRTAIIGGAPVTAGLLKKIEEKLHISDVIPAYGMTECCAVTFMSKPSDPPERRLNTCGYVLDNLEVKIVDNEGKIVPVGSRGEICMRGFCTMLGYWNDPVKTSEVLTADKWYHSGDMAIMDEDGYCEIVGRFSDMIIRGGVNIYPAEIENLLHSHPKIRDAQVVGVPHERLGEELYAVIILQSGQESSIEEIREYCRENISEFKVPKHVKFVTEYPLTVSGKVKKFVLRDELMQEMRQEK